MGVSKATFYRWKKVYAGMGVAEIGRRTAARGGRAVVRHRSEDDGERKLKRLVADLSSDKEMVSLRRPSVRESRQTDALRKKW